MTQVTSNTTIQVAGQIMQQYASKQRFELCSDFRSRLSYNDPPSLYFSCCDFDHNFYTNVLKNLVDV